MNKISLLLLIVFSAVTLAFSQGKTNQTINAQIKTLNAEKYLQLDYNKAADVTKILGFGKDFGSDQDKKNNLSSLTFGITFNYAGERLTIVPEAFILTFWAKSGGKPQFAQAHNLRVFSSGETVDLGDARYATKASEKGMEYLNFLVSRENLKKIAAGGSNVKITLGDAEFSFTSEQLKLFRAILAVSELS